MGDTRKWDLDSLVPKENIVITLRLALPTHHVRLVLTLATLSVIGATALTTLLYRRNRPVRPTVSNQTDAKTGDLSHARVQYGRLPLTFEVNAGQTDKRVKFVSRMSGGNLFLTHKEAVLTLKTTTSQNAKTAKSEIAEIGDSSVRAAFSSVRFQLLDANQNPEVIGQDELAGKSNYFIGDNPAGWRTNIPNYAKVR